MFPSTGRWPHEKGEGKKKSGSEKNLWKIGGDHRQKSDLGDGLDRVAWNGTMRQYCIAYAHVNVKCQKMSNRHIAKCVCLCVSGAVSQGVQYCKRTVQCTGQRRVTAKPVHYRSTVYVPILPFFFISQAQAQTPKNIF